MWEKNQQTKLSTWLGRQTEPLINIRSNRPDKKYKPLHRSLSAAGSRGDTALLSCRPMGPVLQVHKLHGQSACICCASGLQRRLPRHSLTRLHISAVPLTALCSRATVVTKAGEEELALELLLRE